MLMEKGEITMSTDKKSTIGVFSPSYVTIYNSPESAERAENFLSDNGFAIRHGKLWGKKRAFRTGTPKERADEFNELLYDPEVDILMASVGGIVTNGMLPFIDYEYYVKNPKPVVGMSDVTALLMAIYAKTGIPTYYGPNFITSYARLSPYRDIARKSLCEVLNFKGSYDYSAPDFYSDEVVEWTKPLTEEKQIPNKIITLHGGKAKGRLIGGNLWTIMKIWGTPYMPEIKRGDILFIEDTESGADLLESFLGQLTLCKVFELLGGMIIGKFRQYDDCETEKTVYDFIYDYIGKPDYPVLAECDFGHCAPMLTIPIGITAELDADKQLLRLLQ